jgi:hypothetical protein
MQSRAERFAVGETAIGPNRRQCASEKIRAFAAARVRRLSHISRHSGTRALRANPESRNRAPLLDSGSAPSKSAVADLDNNIAELG